MNKWSSQLWIAFLQLQFFKPEKNSGFNGIWTHDLRVTSATLVTMLGLASLEQSEYGK